MVVLGFVLGFVPRRAQGTLGAVFCSGGEAGGDALLSCVCGFGSSPVTADKPLTLAGPAAAFAAVADGNGILMELPQALLGPWVVLWVCSSTVWLWAGRICSLSRAYWGSPRVCFAGKSV